MAKRTDSRRPRVYGYVRVSTLKQTQSGLSLKAQEQIIRSYYDVHLKDTADWAGCWKDASASAYRFPFMRRQSAQELNSLMRRGDHVVCAKLDRMFRNLRDAVTTYGLWESAGINAHFIDIGGRSDTSIGRLVFGVLAAMAQWESDRRSERLIEVNEIRRQRGLIVSGRPRLGMKKGQGGKEVPHEPDLALLAALAGLRKERFSFVEISNIFTRLRVEYTPARNTRGPPGYWNVPRVQRGLAAAKRLKVAPDLALLWGMGWDGKELTQRRGGMTHAPRNLQEALQRMREARAVKEHEPPCEDGS